MEAKPYLKEIILKREDVPSFDAYPFNIPALRNFQSLKFHPEAIQLSRKQISFVMLPNEYLAIFGKQGRFGNKTNKAAIFYHGQLPHI